MPLHVSHIVLDVDGTLVDYDTALSAALDAVAARATDLARAPVTVEMLLEERARVRRQSVAADGAGYTLRAVRGESFRRVLERAGVGDEALVAELSALYYATRDAALRPFDDVEDALRDLEERGFTLIAASNGNAELARLPIVARFTHLHFAETVGVSKPDPRFFAIALEATGGRPATAVSVGDRRENDYEPARAIGMHAVLVDRRGAAAGADVLRIASLAELPGLVELAGGTARSAGFPRWRGR